MKMKWVIGAIAAAVGIIAIYTLKTGGTSVETLKVSKGEMQQYLEDTAQVVAREKQTVYVEGSGKVVNVNVDVGDTVKKGDVLLSLDKTDLTLQLKDAEAKVEAAKAQLKGTEMVNYINKIDQANNAVEHAKIEYDSAKRNLDNLTKLYEANAISKDDYEKAKSAANAASVALDSARLQLEDIKKGAPDYLRNTYAAQLEQAVIFRDTILRNLQKQDVKADIDGIVMERLVEKNSVVASLASAFVIGSIDNLEIEADILADDVNKIKIGNEVEIGGKPVGNEVVKGEVVKIAPAAKNVVSTLGVNQKRVTVTIKIVDKTDKLKPGYNVDVKVITLVKNDVVKVPDTSVFDYNGQSQVFVVENGLATLRPVKKGIESGNYVEIIEGLKDGETIIVKPDNTIKPGAKIKPLNK